jgi:hypothetical protein
MRFKVNSTFTFKDKKYKSGKTYYLDAVQAHELPSSVDIEILDKKEQDKQVKFATTK